jgi:hypothetical protein
MACYRDSFTFTFFPIYTYLLGLTTNICYALIFCYMPYASHPPITFSLVVPNILISTPFSNTPKSSLVLSLTLVKKDLPLEYFLNMVYENF